MMQHIQGDRLSPRKLHSHYPYCCGLGDQHYKGCVCPQKPLNPIKPSERIDPATDGTEKATNATNKLSHYLYKNKALTFV